LRVREPRHRPLCPVLALSRLLPLLLWVFVIVLMEEGSPSSVLCRDFNGLLIEMVSRVLHSRPRKYHEQNGKCPVREKLSV